jgi:hypothetical protein
VLSTKFRKRENIKRKNQSTNSTELSVCSVWLSLCCGEVGGWCFFVGGGIGYHNLFLGISSIWVTLRLYTENQLSELPGRALTIWVGRLLESEPSDRLWLEPNLSQAEQNIHIMNCEICLDQSDLIKSEKDHPYDPIVIW